MICRLISDNIDTLMGMRLAGVEGVVVHERQEVLHALEQDRAKKDVAVIMITEKLARLCDAEISAYKTSVGTPLLVVIPDRHGKSDVTESLSRYLAETVGIHI